MSRPSHARKEVEQALRHAESKGWRVVVGGGIVGENVLPVERCPLSVWGVLHYQYLEHPEEPWQFGASAEACG